jgi:hypothetical protein
MNIANDGGSPATPLFKATDAERIAGVPASRAGPWLDGHTFQHEDGLGRVDNSNAFADCDRLVD